MPLHGTFVATLIAVSAAGCSPDPWDDSLGGTGRTDGAFVVDRSAAPPACGIGPEVAPTPPPGAPSTTMQDDAGQLDATLAVAERGLPRLDRGEAIQNIEVWQAKLRSSNDPVLGAISPDLEQLQNSLSTGDLAPATLGPLLVRLGQRTTGVAASAEPDVSGRLTRLGTVLTQAGNQLGGRR